MQKYSIHEIFYSIQGEGTRVGVPTIFIRTFGCNLHCWYCDTDQSNIIPQQLTGKQIIDLVTSISNNPNTSICITGGEPLLTIDYDLLSLLSEKYHDISIETNGTIPLTYERLVGVTYTMDYKTDHILKSDEMKIRDENLTKLHSFDEVKIVTNDPEELNTILEKILKVGEYPIIISPIWDKEDMQTLSKKLVEVIKKYKTNRIKFQHQLHKHIWGNETKGV